MSMLLIENLNKVFSYSDNTELFNYLTVSKTVNKNIWLELAQRIPTLCLDTEKQIPNFYMKSTSTCVAIAKIGGIIIWMPETVTSLATFPQELQIHPRSFNPPELREKASTFTASKAGTWFAISRQLIRGTRNLEYSEQLNKLKEVSSQLKVQLEIPTAVECCYSYRLAQKKLECPLFFNVRHVWNYTICQESFPLKSFSGEKENHFAIGFHSASQEMSLAHYSFNDEKVGAAAMVRLEL